jgi:hypothetical protein
LFADDTNLIISNPDSLKFEKDVNETIRKLKKWFHRNLLIINLEKTHSLQFLTENSNEAQLQRISDNMQISNIEETKFLGLMINNRLSWQNHINLMISKLNVFSYQIRSFRQLLDLETLKNVYFSVAHWILSYNIIFCGISKEQSYI